MAFTVCCSRLVPLRWLTVIQHPLYHNALPLESQVQLFIVIQSFPKLYEIQCVRYIYIYIYIRYYVLRNRTDTPYNRVWLNLSIAQRNWMRISTCTLDACTPILCNMFCFLFFFFYLFFLHNYFLQFQLLFYRQSLEATYINRGMWF